MKKKVVSGIMLILLLIGMLTLAFNIQHVAGVTEYYLFIQVLHPQAGYTDPQHGVMHWYPEGTIVEVTAYPDPGINFWYWYYGPYNYSNPMYVTMDSDYWIQVMWSWDVTIKAYCITEGKEVNVNITMDYSPTGYKTPHTFTELTDAHVFTVPSTDPQGDPFNQWSQGGQDYLLLGYLETGTYTAYYGIAPWDVNGDRIVDIVDLTIVALALWSEPGDPNWNPNADVHEDEIIDVVDLTIVSIHLWETW